VQADHLAALRVRHRREAGEEELERGGVEDVAVHAVGVDRLEVSEHDILRGAALAHARAMAG
jgi:hypothetical protein